MLFGHLALGLAAKRIAPQASLGVLLTAAVALDTLAGAFIVAGAESAGEGTVMAWTHGLFMSAVWAIAVFAVVFLVLRKFRYALVLGGLVFSHWIFDFISHPMGMGQTLPPDLPLFFRGSPLVGLGLYTSVPAALIVDFGLFAAGIALYLTATKAVNKLGVWAFWAMIGALVISMPLTALAGAASPWLPCLLQTAIVLPMGLWVDRNRGMRIDRLRASLAP